MKIESSSGGGSGGGGYYNFSSNSSSSEISSTPTDYLLQLANSSLNLTSEEVELPSQFTQMTSRSRNEVVAYLFLFFIAATGNLTVFFSVSHQLGRLKWRITVLMLHLSIADLIVTFFLMPVEICWRLTIQWVGGEVLCKLCQFFRAFGLYLSSNILICISLDRFMAILFPLRMVGATRRVKTMIAIAWITAAISSLPQCIVFSVQVHPKYPSFHQCVSFGFFSTPTQQIIYNVFSVSAMYFIPLLVTIFTYSMILWKISSKSNGYLQQQGTIPQSSQNRIPSKCPRNNRAPGGYYIRKYGVSGGNGGGGNGGQDFSNNCRRTGRNKKQLHELISPSRNQLQQGNYQNSESVNLLARAKKRTLRMTLIICIIFVLCWSPYAFITLWYTFDKEGATRLEPSLQDAFFMMAVANSCLNPIVYGNYTKKTSGPLCLNCMTIRCYKRKNQRRRISTEDRIGGAVDPRTSSLLAITSVI